jgi:hypothetical protein
MLQSGPILSWSKCLVLLLNTHSCAYMAHYKLGEYVNVDKVSYDLCSGTHQILLIYAAIRKQEKRISVSTDIPIKCVAS